MAASKRHFNKLLNIIEKHTPDCSLVLDKESEKGLFVILDSWESLSKINYYWNYRKKAFKPWKRVYELSGMLYPPCGGIYEDMRLGYIHETGPGKYKIEGINYKHLRKDMPKNTSAFTVDEAVNDIINMLWVACLMIETPGPNQRLLLRAIPQLSGPPYETPEGIEELGWDGGVAEYGFSDEYSQCDGDDCLSLIRTSPDSHDWQPDYWISPIEGLICSDCLVENHAEDYIEAHINQQQLVNDYLVHPYEFGFVELHRDFENGYHRGQDDDPAKVIEFMNKAGFDVVFTANVGQFDVNFFVWARPGDWEEGDEMPDFREAGVENSFMPLNKKEDGWVKRANEALNKGDAYQGYSTAMELSQALKQQSSTEHVTLRSGTPTSEGVEWEEL